MAVMISLSRALACLLYIAICVAIMAIALGMPRAEPAAPAEASIRNGVCTSMVFGDSSLISCR